ncbi:MAG: hypothetical protein NC907_05595, partial [Candidatus Omnitrophica bacterium]|nr:hypothetical protein [Candidatus Omnitrophota bacterium]
SIKNSSVSIPVEEFSKLVKDAKISLPWTDFARFLISEADVKYIKVPWEMFLKYLQPTIDVKPVKPPVDYILANVSYSGKPGENWCELKFFANLAVLKNPADGWTTIKLWPTYNELVVSEMRCDGKPINIYPGTDGNYQIFVNQQGTFVLEGTILLRLHGKGESFALPSIPNTGCMLHLSLPEDYQVLSSRASMVKIDRTNKLTQVHLAFAPGSSIDASWAMMTKQPSEPRILASASISSYIQPELVKTNASIRYEILYQPVKSLKILLPDGVKLNNVSGNILDWKQTDSTVQIELKPGTKGSLEINISYEQDINPDAADVSIKSPSVPDAEKITGYFSVASTQNLEVSPIRIENILAIDPKEVPGALTTTAVAFKFHRLPFLATLKIVRYQELPVLEATCDSVNAITATATDGKIITRVIYHIRNNARQFLTVHLPEKSHLWSVYVANNPTKPLDGKSGSILIPILRDQWKTESTLPVEVIYYQGGIPFGKTGEFQISLPTIDIPVMYLMYSLYIPEKLTLDNFSGNLEKVERFSLLEESDKKITGNKPEEKQEISQKGTSQSILYFANQQVLEKNVQTALSDRILTPSTSGRKTEQDSGAGLLPLKIYIPTTGKLLRFEKRLIMDENIFMKARYKISSR